LFGCRFFGAFFSRIGFPPRQGVNPPSFFFIGLGAVPVFVSIPLALKIIGPSPRAHLVSPLFFSPGLAVLSCFSFFFGVARRFIFNPHSTYFPLVLPFCLQIGFSSAPTVFVSPPPPVSSLLLTLTFQPFVVFEGLVLFPGFPSPPPCVVSFF